MPAHALTEPEDIGAVVRLRPRFGEIRLERLGARDHGRPGLHLDEPAVGERQVRRDPVMIGHEVWIEAGRRLLAADPEHAAPSRGLGGTEIAWQEDGAQGRPAELKKLATCEGGRSIELRHGWPPVAGDPGRRRLRANLRRVAGVVNLGRRARPRCRRGYAMPPTAPGRPRAAPW